MSFCGLLLVAGLKQRALGCRVGLFGDRSGLELLAGMFRVFGLRMRMQL
jgi:hypothetical protein